MILKKLKLTSLLLLNAYIAGLGFADDPELSADTLDFVDNKLSAAGNASIDSEELKGSANTITFDRASHEATAECNVILDTEDFRLLTDDARVNIDSKNVCAQKFRFGNGNLLLEGVKIEGTPNDMWLSDSTLYFSEPDRFSLNLKAKLVHIYNKNGCEEPDRVTVKGVKFRIGKIPFFYLPHYTHNISDYPISWSFDPGYGQKYGAYVRNDILFNIRENIQIGALLDLYSSRGVLIGPAAHYTHCSEKSQIVEGDFRSGYIHDFDSYGTDINGKQISDDRYFAEWRHLQHYRKRFTMLRQVRWWSDSEVLRDFRPILFAGDPDPDSFGEFIYTGDHTYISLFTRLRVNRFQRVQTKMPELTFELLPSLFPIKGLYHKGTFSYARIQDKFPGVKKAPLEYSREDAFYGLFYPIKVCRGLVITPVAGGRATHYMHVKPHAVNDDSSLVLLKGQVGVDAQFNLFGQWNYKNAAWEIDGLRHIFRPVLQYRYIPVWKYGTGTIPQIEPARFTTNLETLDLGYRRDRDSLAEEHTLRVGLENLLQTRRECGYGSRDLLKLGVYQDIQFKERFGSEEFSDFYTELGLYPAPWVNFGAYCRFNWETLTLNELRTQLRLIDGRIWALNLHTDFLNNVSDQYYLEALYNINRQYCLIGGARYDARRHQFIEQHYGLKTRLGHDWLITYGVTIRKGARRENEYKGSIKVDLLAWN